MDDNLGYSYFRKPPYGDFTTSDKRGWLKPQPWCFNRPLLGFILDEYDMSSYGMLICRKNRPSNMGNLPIQTVKLWNIMGTYIEHFEANSIAMEMHCCFHSMIHISGGSCTSMLVCWYRRRVHSLVNGGKTWHILGCKPWFTDGRISWGCSWDSLRRQPTM